MATGNGVSTSGTLLRALANPDSNEAAWRIFLERYQPLIHRWCCRWGLNHNQAEEVTEAVLAKLVTVMRTFVYDPTRRFRGWLRKVVWNEVRSSWRRAKRHPGDQGTGDPEVHRQLEQLEAPGDVDGLVQELDETLKRELRLARQVTARVQARVQQQTWRAFWLTVMKQKPPRDVARRLGMSVAAVYMAKHRVAQLLDEEGAKVRGQDEGRKAGES
jgi:RNA polymerase sigma factor (sigma-70 family)